MRCGRIALVSCLILSACAIRPTVTTQSLSADQQHSVLRDLSVFSFTGRVAVTGQDSIPSMKWEQQRDATRVKLSAPIGLGSMQFDYSPGRLRLVTSRGEKLEGSEAEAELVKAMGFLPPFESLRYWILGMPAPGTAAPVEAFDAAGLMQQLQQQGWTISYKRRMAVNTASGALQMPARLDATRGELALRLVIERWGIKQGK
jgi:outer membrane lipoprotein LolB